MWRLVILSALALALALTPDAAAQRPQTVEPGRFETIRLDGEGRAVLRFDARAAGLPVFDLMAAPDGLDAVTLSAPARDEKAASTALVVLPSGRHELVLQGQARADGQPMEIQGRLRLDPPFDAFEPNDHRDQALPIDLPFYQVIRLAEGDEDWFRVEAERGGVIGIHLHHGSGGYDGPQMTVMEADGTVIFQTDINAYSWRSMRYVRSGGRPILIRLTDSRAWRDNQAGAFKALEIVRYAPDAPVNGTLVTLGVESEDPSFYQLALVGEAVGTEVRGADEAAAVASELTRAVEARNAPVWPNWLGGLLLALALAGGGYWYLRRRGAAS
ncbi:hypothetical protein [Maricaulis sp.]|uniref:hypothetical protein n=1 Tax=Maricaulis sp. TaxID=1486257 RepID=UPI003A8CA614